MKALHKLYFNHPLLYRILVEGLVGGAFVGGTTVAAILVIVGASHLYH